MVKKFQKRKEDFDCEKCGTSIQGSGYTNHCPKCLWSKHVDINPGDRKSNCKGCMEPVSIEKEGDEYVLSHQCITCGHTKRNRMCKDDNFNAATKIGK
jgi:hypothetical protein